MPPDDCSRTEPKPSRTVRTFAASVGHLGFGMIPVWLLGRPEIKPGWALLYAVLLSHADAHGRCFPDQERLAKLLWVTEARSVRRYLAGLIAIGLLAPHEGKATANNPFQLLIRRDWIEEFKADRDAHTGQNCPQPAQQDTPDTGQNCPEPKQIPDNLVLNDRTELSGIGSDCGQFCPAVQDNSVQPTGQFCPATKDEEIHEEIHGREAAAPRDPVLAEFGFDPRKILEGGYYNCTIPTNQWEDLKFELRAFREREVLITEELFRRAVAASAAVARKKTSRPPSTLTWLINELAKLTDASCKPQQNTDADTDRTSRTTRKAGHDEQRERERKLQAFRAKAASRGL